MEGLKEKCHCWPVKVLFVHVHISITAPYLHNFQNVLSPRPCLLISSSKNPPCPWNSKKLSMVWYGYFLELPNKSCFHCTTPQLLFRVVAHIIVVEKVQIKWKKKQWTSPLLCDTINHIFKEMNQQWYLHLIKQLLKMVMTGV